MKNYICIASADSNPFIPDTIIPCDEEFEIVWAAEYLRNAGLPAHPVLTGEIWDAVETGLVVNPAE